MPFITEDLLRKRSEHNDCMLSTLEEVALHQQELQKIEHLDKFCRHLKILYLQNNIVERMENLHKLKELQYLNLALNNVSMIEDIDGCQSLKKLDLTLNFIDGEDFERSMDCLQHCPSLKELFMTGNPCMDWRHSRAYILARAPQLEVLDGKQVLPSERIRSAQMLPELELDLEVFIQERALQKHLKELQYEQDVERRRKEAEAKGQTFVDTMTRHTKQARRKMYSEMAAEKEQKERSKNPQKYVEKKESPMFNSEGKIRQCNEGRYRFVLDQHHDPEWTLFQVQIPRFMDTSLLVLKLDPHWVSLRIKGKLLQLRLDDEIEVAQSKSQRSQISGKLVVMLKKLKTNSLVKHEQERLAKEKAEQQRIKKEKEAKEQEDKKKRLILCSEYQAKMAKKELELDDVPDLQ